MIVATAATLAVLALAVALGAALRFPGLPARAPKTVCAATALISIAAVAALFRFAPPGFEIELDPSSTPLLPVSDPGIDVYRRAVLEFGSDEIFVVAMQARDVFTHENLLALRRVSSRILALRSVRSTESLVDTASFRHDPETDALLVRPFIEQIPAQPEELLALRQHALADRLYAGSLVSKDATAAAVNVRFQKWTDVELVRARADDRIRAILEEETTAERRFYVAGRRHVNAEAHRVMRADLGLLMPLVFCVMALVLWIVVGSARGIGIPLGNVLLATLWTFGAMAWLEADLNAITIVLGPILIAVGSVYGVHVLAHCERLAEATPTDPGSLARALVERTRAAVLISGLSTAAGFIALLLTESAATRELGAFAALGVACVTLLSVTALPACVALLPAGAWPASGLTRRIASGLDRALETIVGGSVRHAWAVIALWGTACIAAAILIPRIAVDTDYLSFFPERSSLRRDFDTVNRLLAGSVPLYLVFSGDGDGSFREPAHLSAVEAIQEEADALGQVTHSVSMIDLLGVVRRALQDDDPRAERLPDSRREVAELLLLVPKASLRPLSNVNQSRANLLLRTGELGSSSIRALVGKLEGILRRTPLPAAVSVEITGETLLVNRSADGIARSQVRAVGVAALAVFTMVALVFRSLRLALVALVPNAIPVLLFYGLLGAGAAPLSLPTSLIGSVALGIAVDDTMHFLVAYRRARAAGADPAEAAVECGRHVGRPIAITSAMLFLGFLVVGLSGFATLAQFGLLIGLTLGLCLVTDLVLLPAVLTRARV